MSDIIDVMKLLASGQIKFGNGDIKLLGQPVSFVPIDWVITFHKQLEKNDLENVIYYTAKDMGVKWFKNMYDHFKISPEDVIRWGINILSVSGWGETSTPEIKMKEKFYTVELKKKCRSNGFRQFRSCCRPFCQGMLRKWCKGPLRFRM